MVRRTQEISLTLLAVCLLAAGCATVPETGRHQVVVISPGEELKLGIASFDQLKKQVPVSTNKAANALLQEVGRRISAVAQLPNAQWEFVLFESPEANAFCLPGGKVGVYTGILPVTANAAGLATVIGHEVAHAVARHGAERMSEAMFIQLGGAALGYGLSEKDPKWQAAAATAYGLGTTLGRELPNSRSQESEADYIGMLYLARAGYPPAEAIKFWERFAAYNQKHSPGETLWFLRTHPLDQKRIEQLKTELPKAQAEYRPPR